MAQSALNFSAHFPGLGEEKGGREKRGEGRKV